MATDIHKINVKLEMENAKLLKKLDQSEKKLQRFGKSAKSSVDSVKKVFAGLAAVAGAVKFTASVKASIDAADKFAKMSQQVNVSVESLSTLQHAASLSGSSLESMDKGLRRLSTNLLDANRGLKESEESFEALGVGVTDSQGNLRDVESVLLDVADKFSKTKDSTEKTALAMKLFGKSGAELIPLLNAGSDGIRAMQDEARALGLEISGPTARAAELFNDNMERLQKVAQGFVNALAAKGLPVLVKLSEILLEGSPKVERYGDVIEGLSEDFKTFIETGLLVKNTLDVLATGFTSVFRSIFHAVQGDFKAAINVFVEANKSIRKNVEDITNGLILLDEISTPQPRSDGGSRSSGTSLATITLPTTAANTGSSVSKSIEDANGPMAEWNRLQSEALSVYEATRTPLENLKTEVEQYTQLLESGLISQDTFSRAVAQSNQAYLDTQKGIERVANKTEEVMTQMTEFAMQAARNVQDALEEFLIDPFEDGLEGMFRGFVDILRRMTAASLAAQANNFLLGEEFQKTGRPGGALGGILKGAGIGGEITQTPDFNPVAGQVVTPGDTAIVDAVKSSASDSVAKTVAQAATGVTTTVGATQVQSLTMQGAIATQTAALVASDQASAAQIVAAITAQGASDAASAAASGLNLTGGTSSSFVSSFANFLPTFHTGGISPREQLAILEKGEEVLTANDPRHSKNQGNTGNVIKLTINATDAPSVLRSRAQIERELMAGIGRAQRNA